MKLNSSNSSSVPTMMHYLFEKAKLIPSVKISKAISIKKANKSAGPWTVTDGHKDLLSDG